MSVQFIVPAGGVGTRFGNKKLKTFQMLGGKPMIIRTLETLDQCALIEKIILVSHADYIRDYQVLLKEYGIQKVSDVVAGGSTRTGSVRNGLAVLSASVEIVGIHDAARPLLDQNDLVRVIDAAKETGAAVLGTPAVSTIKSVDPVTHKVTQTLNRSQLWEIQTPQVFRRELILNAYRAFPDDATDDAALVEGTGHKVRIVRGSYRNMKITTPDDLIIAEALIEGTRDKREG